MRILFFIFAGIFISTNGMAANSADSEQNLLFGSGEYFSPWIENDELTIDEYNATSNFG